MPPTRRQDDLRSAIDAFRRIVQALRMSTRESEQRVGLSSAQLFALQQLAASPGASVNELAARTFTHQSSVSVVVQKLVDRRLVTKAASRDDRRRVQLELTDAGRALLRRSPEPAQERLIAGISSLGAGDRRAFAAALRRIAATMTGDGAHPPMFFEDERGRRDGRAAREVGERKGSGEERGVRRRGARRGEKAGRDRSRR